MLRPIGRYLLAGPIAVGGMASVHLGKLSDGSRRTVAIKRMLQTYAANPQARAMLLDEARLTAQVHHPNVVQLLDVVEQQDELFLVLEYVQGESLDRLLERGGRPPVRVTTAIVCAVLRGLHAAHEARGEDGQPLELVHRDLSPHNVLVDVHGVARVLDFGVARARGRLQATQDGQLKGKFAYLAPEQVHGDSSRRSDLFTAGVVLWESLAGRQLFAGTSEAELLSKVLLCRVPTLASVGVEAPALEAIVSRALDREPERRFATAAQMADALEACGVASAEEIAAWVQATAADTLTERARLVEALERMPVEAVVVPRPRRKWPVAVAVGAAAVLAVGAVLVSFPRAVSAPAPAPAAPVLAVPIEAPPPAPEPPAAAPVRKSPTSASPRPRPACNPPFVIDANGVKRFKVECLH